MIHHSIVFLIDKEKGKEDGKLRMRVRWGKDNRVAVNVGYRVDVKKWSKESQRCKANTSHGTKHVSATEINREIQRYNDAAEKAFLPFIVGDTEPTEELYRQSLKEALGRQEKRDMTALKEILAEYMRYGVTEAGWSSGTREVLGNLFDCILEEYPELKIEEMASRKWLSSKVEDMIDNGRKNTTLKNWLTSVKTFLYWCAKRKYISDVSEVKEYQPKFKVIPHTVVWLTWEEIMKLYNAEIDDSDVFNHRKRVARDMFCLSCFTGLRYSDLHSLTWDCITEDSIRLVIQKTSKPIIIELNKYSRAIIQRLKSSPDRFYPEYAIPLHNLSSSTMNASLKVLCKELDISEPIKEVYYVGADRKERNEPKWKRLSMHCGRRTFICNALEMGISPQVVMSWTGHSNYESMKPYIAISDNAKATAMKKFDK